MARKIISKKDHIDEIKQILAEQSTPSDAVGVSLIIREKAGGSISALTVQSEEHRQWLTALQEKNPFIGKNYMMKAEEYETEDKVLSQEEAKQINAEMAKKIDAGTEAYDPNSDYGEVAKDLKEKRDSGNVQRKMIEHAIASNTTRKLIGKTDSEIAERALDEIRTYYDDGEYQPTIDITKSIEMAKVLLISSSIKKNEQLKSDS